MKLLIEKIKLAILKRSKVVPQKSYASWLAKGYNDTPLVSIIIQSHNKSLQVCHILPKLRKYGNGIEIIVIDDGSSFDHTQRLAKELTGANEFLIRANDLYENRTYDKAIRFSNGKFIALLQDDDDFDGIEWIEQAIRLFEQHPKMAILGGKGGFDVVFNDEKQKAYGATPMMQEDFTFATTVNRAPMWIRRNHFMNYLHHIDFHFAPFQYDDDVLCARTWLCGLQVGWYNAQFHSLSAGGMRLYNNSFAQEQHERNSKLFYQLYADKRTELQEAIEKACSKK